MVSDSLRQIADMLEVRNQLDEQIAAIISRPMTAGHLGEWIAAQIFDIELAETATATAIDGHFGSGPLKGRSVNVKWYLKQEGLLDMTTPASPDEYLVMTGPTGPAASSKGHTRPWRIDHVYLFDAGSLRAELHGRHIGTASSIRKHLWVEAEIYPQSTNRRLPVTDVQAQALQLFRFP